MSEDIKVRLEPLALEHLDGIMTWVNDPEVTFYFARAGEPITREAEARYVSGLMGSATDRIYSIFVDAPLPPPRVPLADDAPRPPQTVPGYVGQIGLSQIYWPARNGRLGIMLPRYAWGRGVAQAAGRALLEVAFGELELNKVWLIVRSSNAKSLHLWTKVGFSCEGVLREEYFSQGRYHDMMRLSILAREHRAARG